MSDTYESMPFDDLYTVAGQRGIRVDFNADRDYERARIIVDLIALDRDNSREQKERIAATNNWRSGGSVAERVLAGLQRTDGFASPSSCSRCFDTGWELVPGEGARRCLCETEKALRNRIAASLAIVPERYQGVTLADLQPRSHIHPDQPKIVADLKAHPDANYFFCGKPDAGKTHFMWALFHHDASQGRLVFASTLFKLIKAITDQMFGRQPEIVVPDLNVDRISIFIEDVNKARPTEFVYERFFDFIDEIYNRKHRIVVTSQVDPSALAAHFERAEGVDGTAIVRRMNNEDTTVWRMF